VHLPAEPAPEGGDEAPRLLTAARTAQRRDPAAGQPLVEIMGKNHALELGQHRVVLAGRQPALGEQPVGVEQKVIDSTAQLFRVRSPKVRQRLASPQRQRTLESGRIGVRPGSGQIVPESVQVHSGGIDVEPVGPDPGHTDQSVAQADPGEHASEPTGDRIQRRPVIGISARIPEEIDEHVRTDRLTGPMEQGREHSALLGRAERDRSSVVDQFG
jgi:hypothetical protein